MLWLQECWTKVVLLNMGLAVAAQFQIVSGQKGLWGSHAVHSCSAPALPAGGITALEAVNLWKRHFAERGVTEPDHSSHYIIAYLFGAKTLESLDQRRLTEFLSPEKTEQMWKLCSRRLSRMPVQYVIEEWDFRDLTLKMRPPVFIPRPETEELVELVLTDLEMKLGTGAGADTQHTCLEVGCGSGAISLSLLKSLPQLKAIALDQSQDAVDLTGENALRFEDHAALDGGKDGLKVIKQILTLAPQILLNHGRVYLEVDPRHPLLIQRWVEANVEEMHYVETRHDITGRPRFCILRKEKSNKEHKLDLD
ncbi:MTRF1L release factor glutamine methyltransferase isoform X3 [Sander lucioperca]|uniref:MTRF1L release factor glutamine methyltransferase isoform X3 n=1 Tax=Sander lucioperca TaxID=283035 RepID=UPI001653DF7D|nr:MTRF1L release factor glutamine methyltransferase isoform X3 [Sander lucioperca]